MSSEESGILEKAGLNITAWPLMAWAAILGGVLVIPFARESETLGDDLIRGTIRVALLFYGLALVVLLGLRAKEWSVHGPRVRVARWCWTLAWVTYLVHLGMAMHYYHHWSHADAMEHTREVSGVGEGIFISHLFTLLWSADVSWWWLSPRGYDTRNPWIGRLLHGFMLFIVFNGTVIYEDGWIRYAGLLGVACVALVGLRAWQRAGTESSFSTRLAAGEQIHGMNGAPERHSS